MMAAVVGVMSLSLMGCGADTTGNAVEDNTTPAEESVEETTEEAVEEETAEEETEATDGEADLEAATEAAAN